jgi:peroxiredoxin Q/BCP
VILMSGKKAKAARRTAREPPPPITPDRPTGPGFWTSRQGGLVVVGVIAVIAASFVLPGAFKKGNPSEASHATAMAVGAGTGLPAGSPVPTFSAKDLNETTISNKTVYGHKTLLFFSEGVMCQACFQQIQGLQQVGNELDKRGIRLVSITPDSTGELKQAASQYDIVTPLISDSGRAMSAAFNTSGGACTPTHPGTRSR